MESYDIKTSIDIGKQIFESVPSEIVPEWGGLILSRFDNYIADIPQEIKELYTIIENKQRWKESHDQFTKIREFQLNNDNYNPESYLRLAEAIAKVTYNLSGSNALFDADSGWCIPGLALRTASELNLDDFEYEIKAALLIFIRNKKAKINLQTAENFVIYKKIDDILWFEWDPIGVNDIAPRDEYQSYVIGIMNLKQSGAAQNELAQALFRIETEQMGLLGNFERCISVANKIVQL
jgi:hypothetical protein